MSIKTDKLGSDVLMAAAKTSMGSKIVGAESDFFGQMVVDAIKAVETTDQVGWRQTEDVASVIQCLLARHAGYYA